MGDISKIGVFRSSGILRRSRSFFVGVVFFLSATYADTCRQCNKQSGDPGKAAPVAECVPIQGTDQDT